jgi:hypothetical protein
MKFRLTAACAAIGLLFGGAAAQTGGMSGPPMQPPIARVQLVLCPTHVSVVLDPTAPAPGWTTNHAPVALSLDAKNPPRVESNTLICYYAMPDGYNAFVYYQPEGSRTCIVNPARTGFECH